MGRSRYGDDLPELKTKNLISEDGQQLAVVDLVAVVECPIDQHHAVGRIGLRGAPPITAPDATILLLALFTSSR